MRPRGLGNIRDASRWINCERRPAAARERDMGYARPENSPVVVLTRIFSPLVMYSGT